MTILCLFLMLCLLGIGAWITPILTFNMYMSSHLNADDFHGHFRHAKNFYYIANGLVTLALVVLSIVLMSTSGWPVELIGTPPVAGFNLGCIIAGCYWVLCAEYVLNNAVKKENVLWLRKVRSISTPSRAIGMVFFALVLIVSGFIRLG